MLDLKPDPAHLDANGDTPILLEISAFLDGVRCAWTLRRALERASFPDRVSFTVLQARLPQHEDCVGIFRSRHLPELCAAGGLGAPFAGGPAEECQQRVLRRSRAWLLDPRAAQGPVHTRGVAARLLEPQDLSAMCLSTDAHMDFNRGWDVSLIEDWLSAGNEFAVLTVYPESVDRIDKPVGSRIVSSCGYTLEEGIPRGRQAQDYARSDVRMPLLTPNWAAGFSFHRCHAEKLVPVDWRLRWIFTGEEVNRAVRLWTHGYDLYAPASVAVLHNYTNAKQEFQQFGDRHRQILQKRRSQRQVRRLLETLTADDLAAGEAEEQEGLGRFGLGAQRSLEEFVMWSRANLGGKWARALMDPWGRVQDTRIEDCLWLQRRPIRDPGALLQSLRSPSGAERAVAEVGEEVLLAGEEDVVRPKRVL
ncbi:unnamed protein product [Prorocentrum cordatum]|uniref:Uncharacterized protein n=1 Tax=Prorocentrum cordatum TaxID=2364126 RepID=A0ABN9Q3V3_9DINO|nr:unnamed protein product [Polarella glacialis]